MKRLLTLLFCLGLFTQCRRDYRAFDMYFWSSDTTHGAYHLYLNKHYAGELPLRRHLPSGRYQVEVIDDQGHRCFQGHFMILRRPGNLSISSDIDNARITTHGSAFAQEFYTKERPNS